MGSVTLLRSRQRRFTGIDSQTHFWFFFFSSPDPADTKYCQTRCRERGCCESLTLYFVQERQSQKHEVCLDRRKKIKKKKKWINTSWNQIKFASRRLRRKMVPFKEIRLIPLLLIWRRTKLHQMTAVIRHHYQRQKNVLARRRWQCSLCNGMIWITLCRPTLHPSHFLCLPVKRSDDREHDIAAE